MSATVHKISHARPLRFVSFFNATHTQRLSYASFDRIPDDDELRDVDDHIKAFARTQGNQCWGSYRSVQGNLIEFRFRDTPDEKQVKLYQRCFERWSAQNEND